LLPRDDDGSLAGDLGAAESYAILAFNKPMPDRDSMAMDDLIRRADAWLRGNRPDYYAILRPGASDAALDAYAVRFGMALPSELRQLYGWRDGQDLNISNALVHNHMFMPLEQSASSKDQLDGMIGFDFDDPNWWRRGWVPFTLSYGGDHYCVDLDAEAGAAAGRVIGFWHDEARRPVRAPSFATWFDQLVITMEEGRLEVE
jgi:cell wall assembly regulator SMI1